jgi:hypothetical protein
MTIDFSALPKFVLGINWQTTAAAIAPLFTSISLVVTAISKGEWPSHEDEAVIFSFLSIAWGFIRAKDRNVTGGSVSNVDGSKSPETVSMITKAGGTGG